VKRQVVEQRGVDDRWTSGREKGDGDDAEAGASVIRGSPIH